MSILDRLRDLFGGKQSGADATAVTGGSVAATSNDDVDAQAGSESAAAGESSGGAGDGGSGGGSGDGGGGGSAG